MATGVDLKLLKSTKFPAEFNQKVDITKVNIGVMKKWIAGRVTEILGTEDDVIIELIFNLLESVRNPDIKLLQIQLTGFLEKDTAPFCKELWKLLLSAQASPQGVPKELLEAKKQELLQEKIEADKAAEEARKRREELDRRDYSGGDRGDRGDRGGRGGRGAGRGGDSWRGRRDDRDRGGFGGRGGGGRSRSPPRYRDQRDHTDRGGPRGGGGFRDTYVPRGSPTFRRAGGAGGRNEDRRPRSRTRSPSVDSASSRSPSRRPSVASSRRSISRSPTPRARRARPRSPSPPVNREAPKRRRSPPRDRGPRDRSRSASSGRASRSPKRRRYSTSRSRSRSRSRSPATSRNKRYSRSRSSASSRSRYSRSPSRSPVRRPRRDSRSISPASPPQNRYRANGRRSMTRSGSPVGSSRGRRDPFRRPRGGPMGRRGRGQGSWGSRSPDDGARRPSASSYSSAQNKSADISGVEDRPRSSHAGARPSTAEQNAKVTNELREKELKARIKKMRSSKSEPGNAEANRP